MTELFIRVYKFKRLLGAQNCLQCSSFQKKQLRLGYDYFDMSSMNHRLATHFATIIEFGIPIQNLLVTIRLFPLLASYVASDFIRRACVSTNLALVLSRRVSFHGYKCNWH